MDVLRVLRTVRYLKPVQIYGRVIHKFHWPQPRLNPIPPLRPRTGKWIEPIERPVSLIGPTRVRFLNKEGEISSVGQWNDTAMEKLWLYNLHYFDDLNAKADAVRKRWQRTLLSRWVEENPLGHGDGWESYPISLRIVNWIKWGLGGQTLDPVWLQSLAVQARFLSRRIEWHLLGNHLLANAKALIFAGTFFESDEADAWRDMGVRILGRELPEQVLADGGHFERSPMYHAIIQEDLLDLVNLAEAYPGAIPTSNADEWRVVLSRMRSWLTTMLHPDGGISFFNDAAFGIAAPAEALEGYARDLGCPPCPPAAEGVTHLAESGYVRVQFDPMVAILDVGPIGPDYLPGHAHADTLSFELSLDEQRVVVNSGTSVYGTGPERQRQRGTAAHSTVEVDGEDSSEVWGGFRVARRARPFGHEIERSGKAVRVRCAHDGYRRLPGRVTHWREWRFTKGECLVIDELEGQVRSALAHLHLHPDVALSAPGALRLPRGRRLSYAVTGGTAAVVPDTHHPGFGVTESALCLEIAIEASRCETRIAWDLGEIS